MLNKYYSRIIKVTKAIIKNNGDIYVTILFVFDKNLKFPIMVRCGNLFLIPFTHN